MKIQLPILVLTLLTSLTGCGKKTTTSYDLYFEIHDVSHKNDIIDIFNKKLSNIGFTNKTSNVSSYNDNTLKVSLNIPSEDVLSIVTTVLVSNAPLTMSNAHDNYVYPIVEGNNKAYLSMEGGLPLVNIPSRMDDEGFALMINELKSDIDNDNIEYAIPNQDSGEGEEEYNYSFGLYLWHRFDIDICTYEHLKYEEENADKYLLAVIPFNKDNRPSNPLTFNVNFDSDGDGSFTEQEKNSAVIISKGIIELINETPHNYQIDPVGKPE